MWRTHLLEQLNNYALRRSTLRDVEIWLMEHLQEILDSGGQATINLANQVDADLVEWRDGLLSDETLRDRFATYSTESYVVTGTYDVTRIFIPVGIPGVAETFHFRHVVA